MTPQGRTRLTIWAALVAVFLLGCVSGALLDRTYRARFGGGEAHGRRGGDQQQDAMFEKLRGDLNLNDQQSAQVRTILNETRDEFRKLRDEERPRYDAVRQRARERIRALLTPDQQKLFDAKIAERDNNRRAREGR